MFCGVKKQTVWCTSLTLKKQQKATTAENIVLTAGARVRSPKKLFRQKCLQRRSAFTALSLPSAAPTSSDNTVRDGEQHTAGENDSVPKNDGCHGTNRHQTMLKTVGRYDSITRSQRQQNNGGGGVGYNVLGLTHRHLLFTFAWNGRYNEGIRERGTRQLDVFSRRPLVLFVAGVDARGCRSGGGGSGEGG